MKSFFEKMSEIDDAAERAGGYVVDTPIAEHYDYRKMIKYCRENDKEPTELTQEEIKQFVIE